MHEEIKYKVQVFSCRRCVRLLTKIQFKSWVGLEGYSIFLSNYSSSIYISKVLRKVLPDLCYDFICWQRLRDFQNIHLDTHRVMKYFSIIKDLIIK